MKTLQTVRACGIAGGVAAALLLAFPAVVLCSYMTPGASPVEGRWVRLVHAGDLANEARIFEVPGGGYVYLVRQGGGVVCVSAQCPHLGVILDWDEEDRLFVCPSGGDRFDSTGKHLSGPALKSLQTFPVRDVGGWIEIRNGPRAGD